MEYGIIYETVSRAPSSSPAAPCDSQLKKIKGPVPAETCLLTLRAMAHDSDLFEYETC
jgi:hypothetical protein